MKQKTLGNVVSVGLCSLLASTGLFAQEGPVLEEVTVTATKREVGLQDVPIAVSVVSGAKIDAMGMAELEDVALYMPNVHIAEGGAASQLFIRGIGSGINQGFEQSVGTFIDGVYYGRGQNSRSAFLDLARVEVLKGPQSTLFGKNTIAGAINITSARPTDELEAYVEAGFESEVDGVTITGMLSGPISDNLRGRLVVRKSEDDGWVTNTAPDGDDGPQEDNLTVRATVEWDASDDLMFTLKAEHGIYDVLGRHDLISIANPTANFFYQTFGDPGFTATFGYQKSMQDILQPYFHNADSNILQVTADYAWGDHTFRSISAFTRYHYLNNNDADYSPLRFIERRRDEEHDQISQEFLLSSPTGDSIEYLVGAYFQKADMINNRATPARFTGLPPIDAGVRALINNALGTNLQAGDIDADLFAFFDQETTTYSAFGEFTFNVRDDFRITAGLRYSDDSKEITKSGFSSQVGSTTPDSFLAIVYGPVLQFAGTYSYALSRDESHLTGNINLQWEPNDDTLLYFNVANGYKAGGFDEDNALGNLATAEFEDEEVLGFEVGGKITLFNGRGRLNLAIFSSSFDDLQVSTFDGNAGFVVGNAAESTTQGLEADWEFAVTDYLNVTGALALLNAEYDSFPDSGCTSDQFVAWVAAGNTRATCTQDLSGQQLQFAPDWSANLGAHYNRPVGNNLEFDFSIDINASDDTVIAPDGDVLMEQKAFEKINARVSIGAEDGQWNVAVIGKNLNDEATTTWGNDVPLGSLGFDGTYFQQIDPPRTITLQARWAF